MGITAFSSLSKIKKAYQISNHLLLSGPDSHMPTVRIVNIVATASINQQITLKDLMKFSNVLYDSNVYGGNVAYFKTQSMEGKISIFSSGKLISVGTTNQETAKKELLLVKNFLVKNGLVEDVLIIPKIQNIVIVYDFRHHINLEDLSFMPSIIYEPEQFPGAILHLVEPFKTSILLFASGKAVITGLKSEIHVESVIKNIEKMINGLP